MQAVEFYYQGQRNMAFTATWTYRSSPADEDFPHDITANCYFRLEIINGGKFTGRWIARMLIYKDRETRLATPEKDIPNDYIVSADYVANIDPYQILYQIAKIPYADALDVIE